MLPPLVLLLAGCAEPESDSSEPVGTAEQPINYGFVCLDNDCYPATVAITSTTGHGAYCSGSVVTPYWILTSRHCFDIDFGSLPAYGNFSVIVNYDARSGSPPARRILHTNGTSGPVYWARDPNNPGATDLALFRLDKPVPLSWAKPMHLPMGPDWCGEHWEGTLVGYGGNLEEDEWWGCEPSQFKGLRQFSFNDDWERADEQDNSWTFEDAWEFLFGHVCDSYHGIAKGDSGGSLIRNDTGLLCGVNRYYYYQPVPFPGLDKQYTDAAATDSPLAVNFFLDHLIDAKGNWDGECENLFTQCEVYGRCDWVDQDLDGVSDYCDNCPRVWNPQQTRIDDDPDKDGIGAACDFCEGLDGHPRDPSQDNCNYGLELGLAYPGTSSPPLLQGVDHNSGPPLADLVHYLNAFKPNRCDPVPCPVQDFEHDTGVMPPSDAPVNYCVSPQPDCNCQVIDPFHDCWWTISNVITLAPTPGNGALYQPGELVDVGMRWCDCPFESRHGLVHPECQNGFNCDVDPDLYPPTPGSKWWPIQTYTADLSSYVTGAEFALPLALAEPEVVRWRFVDLVAQFGHEETKGVDGGPTARWINGVLWASVQNSPYPEVQERSHTYQAGDAAMYLLETQGALSIAASDKWYIAKFCPGCPEQFTWLQAKVNDPYIYRASARGLVPDQDVSSQMRSWYEEAALGEIMLVQAAEPLGSLAEATLAGEPILRAVAVDEATTSVSKRLVSADLGGNLIEEAEVPILGSPVLHGDEALVLSGSLRRLAVIGGTVDGSLDGEPEPSGWLLDVDTNEWTEWPLPDWERPGSVLGATFRLEDLAFYLVDQREGAVRLRRWWPGRPVETLATLPDSWAAFDRTWLVAGHAGDVVFAGSTAPATFGGAEQSLLARFVVDEGGRLSFAGMTERDHAILAPPIGTYQSIALVSSDPTGGVLAAASLDELGPAPAGQQPLIHGWPDEAVVAANSSWLMAGSRVQGDVAVLDTSPGPVLSDQAELVIGPQTELDGNARADTVRLKAKTHVTGDVGYNELFAHRLATIDGSALSPLELPVALAQPFVPAVPEGVSDVTLGRSEDAEIEAGSYGAVVLDDSAGDDATVLTLTGGFYGLASLWLGQSARLECLKPCHIHVVGRIRTGPESYVGGVTTAVSPEDIELFVDGQNGTSGGLDESPKAATLGIRSEARARLFVPHGTLWLKASASATGSLVARDVQLGSHAQVSGGGS